MPDRSPEEEQNLLAEHRLQLGAALVLGVLVLMGVVARAQLGGLLSVGWWRHW